MLLITAKLPRSSYYYHLKHLNEPEKHDQERDEIRKICSENKGRYGYRRVTLELRHRGFQTNHKLVMKLMKQAHLTCMLREKKYRSYRGEVGKMAPNLLKRDFRAEKPNSKWTTDITEFNYWDRNYIFPRYWTCSMERSLAIPYQTARPFIRSLKCCKMPFRRSLTTPFDPSFRPGLAIPDAKYQKMLKERGSGKVCPERVTVTTTV